MTGTVDREDETAILAARRLDMTTVPQLLPTVVGAAFGVMIFIGVILPAVWSTKPERRTAALETLKELLTVIKRKR